MAREIKFSLVYRDMWQSSGKYVPAWTNLSRWHRPSLIWAASTASRPTAAFQQVNLLFGENPNVAVRRWTAPFHKAGIQTNIA